jgi:peptide/nickel transport system permease protein
MMARLKRIAQRRLILRHALPNAIAPTVQVIALTCAYLAGGVVWNMSSAFPASARGS